MYNSSTDAYQAAAKIMSHDYANKYANYWSKKNKVIKTGKANRKDAGRQKTYNAEFAAIAEYRAKYPECTKFKRLNWKQSERYFKKIAKSKTYKDLCIKTDASRSGVRNPTLNSHIFVDVPLVRQLGMDVCVLQRLTVLTQSFMSLLTYVVICTMTLDSVGM